MNAYLKKCCSWLSPQALGNGDALLEQGLHNPIEMHGPHESQTEEAETAAKSAA